MPDTVDDVDEHPIIFNEWSINRILAGEKTQTRRIVKPQPPENADKMEVGQESPHGYPGGEYGYHAQDGKAVYGMPCPYGQPGDVLWVREAFRLPHTYDEMSPSGYVEEGQPHIVRFEADEADYNAVPKDGWGRKRPSIHMPRELCRLRLRVRGVRVERVQEISPQDAYAEGIEPQTPNRAPRTAIQSQQMQDEAMVGAFRQKWCDIHGDGAWERNDWVWVVEFSRIDNA